MAGWLFLVWRQWPDQRVHLIFCNVGQGDGILVEQGFSQILIDGGPDKTILSCLSQKMPFWDRKLELVVLTHPDADHLTGLIAVLSQYQVEKFATVNLGKRSPPFLELEKKLSEQNIYPIFLTKGDKISLNKMSFDVVWPDKTAMRQLSGIKKRSPYFKMPLGEGGEINDYVVVLKLAFGRLSALLTGDLSRRADQRLAWRGQLPPVFIAKAPHHGAKADNPAIFYEKTNPRLVAISVGKNKFGHPWPGLIEKLEREGVRVLRTDRQGTIEIVSDGRKVWIKKGSPDGVKNN